jgi:hypothetical protein
MQREKRTNKMDISSATGGQALKASGSSESDNLIPGFGKNGFTFFDFLDIVNPLQHIPVVSTLYRSLTGDEIDPGAKIAGGTLFGGPVGAAISIADVAMEESTGQDFGEHAMAWFDDADEAIADMETAAGSSDQAPGLAFAPGPGIEISQWAATANTGGVDRSKDLRAANDAAPQKVDLATLPPTPELHQAATQAANLRPESLTASVKGPAQASLHQVRQANLSVLQALAADLKQGQASNTAMTHGNPGAITGKKPREAAEQPYAQNQQAFTSAQGNHGMGWFTDEMKNGLARYHEAQKLSSAARINQTQGL